MSTENHGKNVLRWVLASGSKHRAKQLADRGITIDCIPSTVDEAIIDGEPPTLRATRLAEAKAYQVANQLNVPALVIGGDQVAHCNGDLLRKPMNIDRARDQLRQSSGQWVHFDSAFAVVITGPDEHIISDYVRTSVLFRELKTDQIDHYLRVESPLDSAGSFYSEAIGTWLIDQWQTSDPTALVGLPMLALASALRAAGIDPLAQTG